MTARIIVSTLGVGSTFALPALPIYVAGIVAFALWFGMVWHWKQSPREPVHFAHRRQ